MLPGDAKYAEGHHLRPLARGGPDHPRNIICVCPNHHVELDYFSIPIELSTLRLVPEHNLDIAFIEYHNNEHTKKTRTEQNACGNGSLRSVVIADVVPQDRLLRGSTASST